MRCAVLRFRGRQTQWSKSYGSLVPSSAGFKAERTCRAAFRLAAICSVACMRHLVIMGGLDERPFEKALWWP